MLFSGTVDSQATEANDLTVTTGAGPITFTGAVGSGATQELGALIANSTGTTRFNSTVEAASVTTNLGGMTEIIGGTVTTTGDQIYNDPVFLGANTTLTGNDITLASTVNSLGVNRNLDVNTTGGGITTFGNLVGNILPLLNLITNADGTTRINGARDTHDE